jgi:hypothetical protein
MMKLFALIPLLCSAFVLHRVWFTGRKISTGGKLLWSVAAVLFNFLTLIAFLISNPGKD